MNAEEFIDLMLDDSESPAGQTDEGFGKVVASRLADLGRGFIFKAQPIIVLHNSKTDKTVVLKLQRSLLTHKLIRSEKGKSDRQLAKNMSAIFLITRALREAANLVRQGFVEI